jgi:hypothetical protein
MQEHLTTQQMQDFTARRLSAAALLAAAQHLSGCVTCQTQISVLAASAHLSDATLAAYLAHALLPSAQTQAQAHLAACDECTTQL